LKRRITTLILTAWLLLLGLGIVPNLLASTLIASGEYFVNTDPGAGNGTPLAADDTAFNTDIEGATQGSVDVFGLAAGWHRIGIRFRDNNGTWGNVRWQDLCVFDGAESTSSTVPQPAEYFLDDDPGIGKGYPLLLATEPAPPDVQDAVPVIINTGKLVSGTHNVGVRFRSAAGVWGATRLFTFFVFEDAIPPAPPVADIAETEHFWGEPPTAGGGQPATLIPVLPLPGLADGQNLAVSTAVQEIGVRQIGIRFRGQDGQWSAPQVWSVRIDQDDVAFAKVPLHVESNLGIPLYNLDSWWKVGDTVGLKVPPVMTHKGVQYNCLGWIGTGDAPAHGETCSVSFTITKASTLTWIWSDKATYNLQVNNDLGRGTGGGAHVRESTVTATVPDFVYENATVRWRATGFAGSGSVAATGSGRSVVFAIHGDCSITWNWIKQYRVDTPAVNGHVDGNDQWYDTGTATSLTPIADPGHAFDRWDGDGSGTATPGVFAVSSAKRIIARFKPGVNVTLRATQIDGSDVVTSYAKGSVVTVTPAVANVTVDNRRDVVIGWRLEGSTATAAMGDGARIALEMKEDMHLTWVPLRQYRVVPVILPAGGGTVRLSGRQSTPEADWYDLGPLDGVASAAGGYRFVGWYLQDWTEPEFRTLLASELKVVALFQKVQPLTGFVDVVGGALTSPNTGVFSFISYIPTAKLGQTEVTTTQYAAFLNAALASNIIQYPNSISVRGQNPLAVYQAGLNVEWFTGDAWGAEPVFRNRVTGLNFNFALGSPADANVGTPPCTMTDIDDFSVRFRGELEAPAAGSVRFRETTADEITVLIDGQTIIQDT
jgi:hypothetical protein